MGKISRFIAKFRRNIFFVYLYIKPCLARPTDLRCILILNLRGESGRVYRYCYIRQLLTKIPPVLEEKLWKILWNL